MLRYFVFSACLLVSAAASARLAQPATLIQADFNSPHFTTAVDHCRKQSAGARRYDCIQAKLLALQLRENLLARRHMTGEVTISR